jgi:oligopeptide transport system substrate-binding protein
VTYLPITSEAADVNRYKAGEIDIVYTVPINQFAQLKKPGRSAGRFAAAGDLLLRIQYHPAPFNDPRVRRALNMALDKDIIAEKVMGQGQRPAWLISQPDIGGVTCQPDYASWPRKNGLPKRKNC